MIVNYVEIPANGSYELDIVRTRWAKLHCPSYITASTGVKKDGKHFYKYHFTDEKDMIFFMLRWS